MDILKQICSGYQKNISSKSGHQSTLLNYSRSSHQDGLKESGYHQNYHNHHSSSNENSSSNQFQKYALSPNDHDFDRDQIMAAHFGDQTTHYEPYFQTFSKELRSDKKLSEMNLYQSDEVNGVRYFHDSESEQVQYEDLVATPPHTPTTQTVNHSRPKAVLSLKKTGPERNKETMSDYFDAPSTSSGNKRNYEDLQETEDDYQPSNSETESWLENDRKPHNSTGKHAKKKKKTNSNTNSTSPVKKGNTPSSGHKSRAKKNPRENGVKKPHSTMTTRSNQILANKVETILIDD